MWRIRRESHEPNLIKEEEKINGLVDKVLARACILVRRGSYMVGKPDREVYWEIGS
jgi:hypothetical protein